MHDQKLYQTIKKIISNRQKINYKLNEGSFVEKYCQSQLMKKKLKFYDKNQKMNLLMKNFEHLQTYVDLSKYAGKIFDEISKQLSQREIQTSKSPKVISKLSLEEKICLQLGQFRKNTYLKRNKLLDKILNYLEQNSSLSFQNMKNNSPHHQMFQLLNSLADFEKVNQQKNNEGILNMLKIFNGLYNQQKFSSNYSSFILHHQKSKKKQKKVAMLHKISIYLQIALAVEYKQKWRQKSNNLNIKRQTRKEFTKFEAKKSESAFPSTENKMFKRINFKENFSSRREKQGQNSMQNISNIKESNYNLQLTKNSLEKISKKQLKTGHNSLQFVQKRQLLDKFTFRKRNIKSRLIKKMKKFMTGIEEQEKNSKLEKKHYTSALNELQKVIQSSFGQFTEQEISTQENLKELTNIVKKYQFL